MGMELLAILVALLFLIIAVKIITEKIILPIIIPIILEILPLEKDPDFLTIGIQKWHKNGLVLRLSFLIKNTKLPIPFFWIRIKLPTGIYLQDSISQKRLGFVTLSDPLFLDSTSDLHVNQTRAVLHLYDGLNTTCRTEVETKLESVDDGFKILSQYIQGALVGGQREIFRISLRATFEVDLEIMGILCSKNIKCGKTISIGESEKLKAAFREKIAQRWDWWIGVCEYFENQWFPLLFGSFSNTNWLDYYHKRNAIKLIQAASENDKVDIQLEDLSSLNNDDNRSIDSRDSFDTALSTTTSSLLLNFSKSTGLGPRNSRNFLKIPDIPLIQIPSNVFTRNIFPNPEVQISIQPGIITTKLSCCIYFSRYPGLNFSFGLIEFESTLNGQAVARISIDPFSFSSNSRKCAINIYISPIAATRPVSGSVSTIRSLLRGAVAGVTSGLLYKDWGASSTLVGCKNFQFRDSDGVLVAWVSNLVEGVDEIDIPLFSKILRAVIDGKPLEAKDFLM